MDGDVIGEDALGDEHVEVDVQLKGRAEPLDEADRAALAGSKRQAPSSGTKRVEQGTDEQAQHVATERSVAGEGPAEPDGERQGPLSVLRAGKHLVHQMRGDVAGASGAARGTNTAPHAGERHQQLIATSGAADAREAVREHAAAEVLLQFSDHERGKSAGSRRSVSTRRSPS